MLEIWITTLLIVFILSAMTLLANVADQDRRLRTLLVLGILGLNGMMLIYPLLGALASQETDTPISSTNLGQAMGIAILMVGLTTIFLFPQVREWSARFFPKPALLPTSSTPSSSWQPLLLHQDIDELHPPAPPTAPEHGGFRPESMVHLWAMVLLLYFVGNQLMNFFLAGGMGGLADDIGVNYGVLVLNFIPQLLIPVLGVGLFLRRGWRQTLDRLGLKKPSLLGVGVAIISTMGLVFTLMVISFIWLQAVGEETFNRQTQASDALAESINTLGLAFMVAFTAGVGEEIAFRGALQPIFGFWFASVMFVIGHTQYTLTPAALIILLVTLTFGLIRKYLDTTTSIMTHFLYNFTILAFALLSRNFVEESAWLYWLDWLR